MEENNLKENIISYIKQNLPAERDTKVIRGFVDGVHIYYCYAYTHADKDNKDYHIINVVTHKGEESFLFNTEETTKEK